MVVQKWMTPFLVPKCDAERVKSKCRTREWREEGVLYKEGAIPDNGYCKLELKQTHIHTHTHIYKHTKSYKYSKLH